MGDSKKVILIFEKTEERIYIYKVFILPCPGLRIMIIYINGFKRIQDL